MSDDVIRSEWSEIRISSDGMYFKGHDSRDLVLKSISKEELASYDNEVTVNKIKAAKLDKIQQIIDAAGFITQNQIGFVLRTTQLI